MGKIKKLEYPGGDIFLKEYSSVKKISGNLYVLILAFWRDEMSCESVSY